jgi:hypothetical protein
MLVTAAAGVSIGDHIGLGFGGDKMEQGFLRYDELPIGADALSHAGWHKHDHNGCDKDLGFAWTQDKSGATKKHPTKLYTTAAGQASGVGVVIRGDAAFDEQKDWFTARPLVNGPADSTHIDVAFRSGQIMCDSTMWSSDQIGDTLLLNPAGSSRMLPLTEDWAEAEGYRRGACFDGMGWHRFLDTSRNDGTMSWTGKNLFPIVPMYDNNEINAFFFTAKSDQISIPVIAANQWEPKSLSNSEMCTNMCDAEDCDFAGHEGVWSTMHIYLKNHKEVTCDRSLHCAVTFPFHGGCCPSDQIV